MPNAGRRRLIIGAGLAAAAAIAESANAGDTISSAVDSGENQTSITPERMFELAAGLGVAKNRQDVAAALTFMHDDIVLSSPAWGLVARGKDENAAVLTQFFANYPDYEVSFEGYAANEEHFVGWGTVRMTMAADATDTQGMSPNGRRISIPVTIRMTFKDDLIATEHFMCDLAQIAGQSGISIDGMWRNVFGTSPQSATPKKGERANARSGT